MHPREAASWRKATALSIQSWPKWDCRKLYCHRIPLTGIRFPVLPCGAASNGSVDELEYSNVWGHHQLFVGILLHLGEIHICWAGGIGEKPVVVVLRCVLYLFHLE